MWAAFWTMVTVGGLALAAATIWGTEFHWTMKVLVGSIALIVAGNGLMGLAYVLRGPRRA